MAATTETCNCIKMRLGPKPKAWVLVYHTHSKYAREQAVSTGGFEMRVAA